MLSSKQKPGRSLKRLKREANLVASLAKDEVLKMLETQDTFALRIRAGELYAADGDTKNAEIHYRRAIELFPYFTGEGNAYIALAKISTQEEKRAGLLTFLTRSCVWTKTTSKC